MLFKIFVYLLKMKKMYWFKRGITRYNFTVVVSGGILQNKLCKQSSTREKLFGEA